MEGIALFDTKIGKCGIAWTDEGVCGVQLPEQDAAATQARIQRRFPKAAHGETPVDILLTIGRIVALLRGERVDLSSVVLDMRNVTSEFDKRVYIAARSIPAGQTKTYGEIAKLIGEPTAAREVGAALGRNPFALIVPCHRVLAASGKTGGFSAAQGVKTKLELLDIEGANGPLFA